MGMECWWGLLLNGRERRSSKRTRSGAPGHDGTPAGAPAPAHCEEMRSTLRSCHVIGPLKKTLIRLIVVRNASTLRSCHIGLRMTASRLFVFTMHSGSLRHTSVLFSPCIRVVLAPVPVIAAGEQREVSSGGESSTGATGLSRGPASGCQEALSPAGECALSTCTGVRLLQGPWCPDPSREAS